MLRGDLDRLMLRGIIPERAKATAQPVDIVRAEWERFKERWTQVVGDLEGRRLFFASFQFSPIPTSTVSGTFSAAARLHRVPDDRGDFISPWPRHFEQQLVVDGEDHPGVGHRRERRDRRRSSPAS